VTFPSGVFAAVGGLNLHFGNPTNQVAVSADGELWTTYPAGLIPELRSIAYGTGSFVAVGLSGTIVQSGRATQPMLTVQKISDEPTIRITLSGDVGCIYRLQTSTNLFSGNWSDFMILTNDVGAVSVTDIPGPQDTQRFYRALEQ
jgi:hypothetical protein